MKDVVAWFGAVALIFLLLRLLASEYKEKQSRTVQEYEKDVKDKDLGRSLLRVAMIDLERHFRPLIKVAVEKVENENSGKTDKNRQGKNLTQ
ncbi:MAG: hypothetical protein JNN15_03855 [Blastocatellia bacterium]|jgi:hypothetical protein|nr:hypothetical protein [Blastocatellia bacterium]